MVDGWLADPGHGRAWERQLVQDPSLDRGRARAYGALHYVPIDVSKTILEESAEALVRVFPKLRVTGFAANYRDALAGVVERFDRPKLFVFLGSSLGNYETDDAVDLLGLVARSMDPADRLLLGTDLDKDAGCSRSRLRRRPGGDGPVQPQPALEDQPGTRRSVRPRPLRASRPLPGRPPPGRDAPGQPGRSGGRDSRGRADRPVRRGESIHTENSHKYTPEMLRSLADRSGFLEQAAWTDPEGRFRVQLWRASTLQGNEDATQALAAPLERWSISELHPDG